jgi:formylglycine-generating enzyme required for sulfatase activity
MRAKAAGIVAVAAWLAATSPSARTDPFTGMPFVRIEAGPFVMGTPPSEPQREAQEVQHRVTIAKPFYLAIHEVTQAEWTRVMGVNPSHFQKCGGSCPVENVSYLDVIEFVRALDARSAWKGFRLPTEAEWEYACRAGGTKAFGASDVLTTSDANFDGDFPYAGASKGPKRASPLPVGSFHPNAWGVFDMSGNVWEWTSDDYARYPGAVAPDNPAFAAGRKVIRGGSWLFGADSARCGLRYTHRPQDRGPSLGVRLAHDLN